MTFYEAFTNELEKAAIEGKSLSRSMRGLPPSERKEFADVLRSGRKKETRPAARLSLAGLRGMSESVSKGHGPVRTALKSTKNMIKQLYRDKKF